jgi:hypothetical protein
LKTGAGFAKVRERGFVPLNHQKVTAMKKPYRPPKLAVYGDLTEMTKTTKGGMATADGGMTGGSMKT